MQASLNRVQLTQCLAGLICLIAATTSIAHDASAVETCRNLVLDYAIHRDDRNAEAYADLFSEDAELSVLGQTFKGRSAIRDRMANAENPPATRHLMSTVRITQTGDNTATGISYVTVYSAPAQTSGPIPVEGFAAIGEYHDTFVNTADGWKIARRHLVLAMQYQDKE